MVVGSDNPNNQITYYAAEASRDHLFFFFSCLLPISLLQGEWVFGG